MLTQSEAQALQQAVQRELGSRQSAVYQCVAGIVLILALSIIGPVLGFLSEASPQTIASINVLDHFSGIAD